MLTDRTIEQFEQSHKNLIEVEYNDLKALLSSIHHVGQALASEIAALREHGIPTQAPKCQDVPS